MISKREAMTSSNVDELSTKICTRILGIKDISASESIGIYLAFRNEVVVDRLFAPLFAAGKKIFAPVVTSGGVKFGQIKSLTDVHIGFMGVREPNSTSFAKNDSIDLVVVPGLAFDTRCVRVGWGKGHYDKFLASNNNSVTVGAAYDFQVLDKINAKPHDIRMDYVVTEKRVLES